MAFKDMFKSLVNLNDADLEDEVQETAEEQAQEPARPKKEATYRRSAEKKNTSSAGGAMKVVIVRPEVFDEVAGIAVNESTKPVDADLASSVTIAIGGFQALIAKAAQ